MQVNTTDDLEARKAIRARIQQIKGTQRGKMLKIACLKR